MISFTVIGKPEPAGSKRAFVNPKTGKAIVTDANKRAKPWQGQVADAGREAMQEGGATSDDWEKHIALLDGPIAVSMRFWFPRPKKHFGARGLLPSAPEFPTVRPDALKLARAVEDALTGVVWRDDAQIVNEDISKFYGDPARVEVEIYDVSRRCRSGTPYARQAR